MVIKQQKLILKTSTFVMVQNDTSKTSKSTDTIFHKKVIIPLQQSTFGDLLQ